MRDIFFMLGQEAVPNGWTTEGYCKAGGFTSRSFIIEAVFGKSCQILVIYLTKFRKENLWIYFIFSFVHKKLVLVSQGQVCLHEKLFVQHVFVSLGLPEV